MALRPYEVREPWLTGNADPSVIAFAQERFAALARRSIARMQRISASGVLGGEAEGLRSLWDEWCWYQAYHDSGTALLSEAIEQTFDDLIRTVVDGVSDAEANLLAHAAYEHEVEGELHIPLLIVQVVRGVISDAASRRDMYRFEAT